MPLSSCWGGHPTTASQEAVPGGQGHVLLRPLGEWELSQRQGEIVLRVQLMGPGGVEIRPTPTT